ncbi:MAG: hypothetical protein KDK30_18315 [Leptospiraceae bacterium]|nr:hypothetical protein [Leptospiraceae bacterium]
MENNDLSFSRKILFTLVFTFYAFVFYVFTYLFLDAYYPEQLVVPATITGEFLALATALFTGIVLAAYLGASYVVLGGLRSRYGDYVRDYDSSRPPRRGWLRRRSESATRSASRSASRPVRRRPRIYDDARPPADRPLTDRPSTHRPSGKRPPRAERAPRRSAPQSSAPRRAVRRPPPSRSSSRMESRGPEQHRESPPARSVRRRPPRRGDR